MREYIRSIIEYIVGSLPIAIMFFLLLGNIALAIGNPTYVTIGDAYVFRNVLETGDQLYFVRYDVSYSVNQTEEAEDTWQVALYDSTGALVASRPLNYYQHNIISIYLTSAQAIEWGGAHVIKVMGMPSVFNPLIEGTNMVSRTLASGDYYEDEALSGILITQAGILEDDWGITLLVSDKLNSTGSFYFTKAIPNLSTMAPEIYQTTVGGIEWEYRQYGNLTYSEQMQQHEGSRLKGAITDIGSFFGLSEGWSGFWLMSVIYVTVVSIMFPPINNPGWAFIAGFPVLGGAAWLGIGTTWLTTVVIVVLVVAVIFGIYFIIGRFA